MNDNERYGCYLILAAIGFIAWIAMTVSKMSTYGSTTSATQTTTPYTPPPSTTLLLTLPQYNKQNQLELVVEQRLQNTTIDTSQAYFTSTALMPPTLCSPRLYILS